MASFGHIAQGTTKATPMSADKKFSLKVIAPEDGTVTALYVDMQNDGTEIQAFRAGIYNDSVSMSGATLIDQSDVVLVSPGATRSWVAFSSGLNALVTAGNFYWLTLQASTIGGNASFWYDSGVGNELIAVDVFSDGMSSTYGTVESSPTNGIAIYADYVPVAFRPIGLKQVTFSRKAFVA